MQQKLRLNPVDVGRVQQRLKQMPQQRLFDLARGLGGFAFGAFASANSGFGPGKANTSPITALVSS